MNKACKNYTLVEILVTLAIIGILLGIGMPAFQGLIKGNKVNEAARNLSSTLSIARSRAVSQRKYVAVLFFVKSNSNPNTITNIGELNAVGIPYRALRTCYVDFDFDPTAEPPGTDYKFQAWTDNSKWNVSPEGTVTYFENDNNITDDTKKISNVTTNITGTPLTHDYVRAIVFTPYGNMENKTLKIKVVEGVYTPGLAAAAQHDDHEIVITNKDSDGNPANALTLSVNKFTGRVSYEN